MKKKHPEHVNLERWLVSYADFITLLFAFFVVMYAISQADLAKFHKVTAGIRAVFSAGPVGMIDVGGASGGNTANPFENIEPPGGRMMNLPAGKTNTAADPDPALQEIKELLEETMTLELGATDLSNELKMEYDSQGLTVRIAAKDFFDEGQSAVHADLLPLLDRIGRVLKGTNRLFRIEGHTDPYEIKGEAKKATQIGWDLSSARASWVANYWIKKFDFDPSKIGVTGYSHFRPLNRSQNPIDRAKNRRVEIIIQNQSYEKSSN